MQQVEGKSREDASGHLRLRLESRFLPINNRHACQSNDRALLHVQSRPPERLFPGEMNHLVANTTDVSQAKATSSGSSTTKTQKDE
ncbi:hypothetical protein PC119_g18361 [Phytophthora cactorum]|nr:hypothetical protein PC119_g18361 [Phytophthora cactorum]KAG4053836.1 hypothetical protein PC123_g11028 [Phytophthora cactorum]